MMMRCVKNVMRVASTVLDVVQTEGRRGQTRLHHPPPPGRFDVYWQESYVIWLCSTVEKCSLAPSSWGRSFKSKQDLMNSIRGIVHDSTFGILIAGPF